MAFGGGIRVLWTLFLVFKWLIWLSAIFSLPLQMCRKSYCTLSGGGAGDEQIVKVLPQRFNVMSKAVSDELSCTRRGLVFFYICDIFLYIKGE